MLKPIAALMVAIAAWPALAAETECSALLDHDIRKLRSEERANLCDTVGGKPILIVNTASHCGFTPQFKGLESLHQLYKDRGLVVLGVPSNAFRQAASDEQTAARICFVNYGVTFTMLSEQEVRGPDAHQLFQELSLQTGAPSWNFNKYLIDRDGKVVGRLESSVEPMSGTMRRAVESIL